MAYRLKMFDGLVLPNLQTPDQDQNMGSGSWLTSFQQLPDGWYDNYGTRKSPKGIQPITKQCWLVASSRAELKTLRDGLRAKGGNRGRLVVQFEGGALRWTWARMTNTDNPSRPAHGLALPITLIFESVGQIWYELVYSADDWTVGDGTFVVGDGTTELGQNGTEETLTATGGAVQSFTLTHAGNIPAVNLAITVTAGNQSITNLIITNNTTGHTFTYAGTIAAGNSLVVDTGAMSVQNNGSDDYANFTPGNKAEWMQLAADSDNDIDVTVTGNGSQNATIAWAWYDHYA